MKITGRKFIISSSNKMKSQINFFKETVYSYWFLKRSKKNLKNNLKSNNKKWQAKN